VTRVALVPGCLALLPEYASLDDPVDELRAACLAAVAWLGEDVRVIAGSQGARVASSLLAEVGTAPVTSGEAYLIVGNGSACRSEKAPGHLDPRAAGFDTALGTALVAGDAAALRTLDPGLAEELWCYDVPAFVRLGEVLRPGPPAEVHFAGDPFGVQYWVLSWL
jgi:hypothetical protein